MRRAAVAALAFVAIACTGVGEASDPGRLVVTGPEGEVDLVDPESGERESLAGPRQHPAPVQPTASPDGQIVVWTAVTPNGPRMVEIHDGKRKSHIEVPTVPFFYSFDSSSSTVAALGNDPDGEGVALLFLDLSEGEARIADSGLPYYLDWHPTEPTLVVHVGEDELATLTDDGARTRVEVLTGAFQAPAWTEDGRVVALVRSRGATVSLHLQAEGEELAVVDPSDGSYEALAEVGEMAFFDVAGERVAYVDGVGGSLSVIGLDGEEKVEVEEEGVVAFEWSPDGDQLLFHVFDRDVGFIPHVWEGGEVVEFPTYEPTAVFVLEYLPFWSQYVRTLTQWAPDGSAFVYADGAGRPTVWIQPRDGERREVGEGVMASWAP